VFDGKREGRFRIDGFGNFMTASKARPKQINHLLIIIDDHNFGH
jgi:hypothetical protein